MRIKEYFKNDLERFYFPKNYKKNFKESFFEDLDSYLENIDCEDDLVKSIEVICEKIKKIMDFTYRGNFLDAYTLFDSLMSNLINDLKILSSGLEDLNDQQCKYLYRIRTSVEPLKKRSDLFHIRSSKRGIVSTNRYSAPGIPALYCGNSSYICWKELDEPTFNKCYISKLEYNGFENKYCPEYKNPEIFNLGYSLQSIKDNENDDFNKAFLKCYPLILACHYVVKKNNDNFKPEYIFPQMLMQYVITSDTFIGIRYISSHYRGTSGKLIEERLYHNFVFPTKNIQDGEYCENLKKIFRITPPISVQLALDSNIKRKSSCFLNGVLIQNNIEVDYQKTDYAYIENFIETENNNLGKISEN